MESNHIASAIECAMLQISLSDINTKFNDLAPMIDRFKVLHDEMNNSLPNITHVRLGINHWSKIAKRFLNLNFDVETRDIAEKIICIYVDSFFNPQIRYDGNILSSPYTSVQSIMKCAIHIGWYQIFRLAKHYLPQFLAGIIDETISTNPIEAAEGTLRLSLVKSETDNR